MDSVRDIALRAKAASAQMMTVSCEDRNKALFAMAAALRENVAAVLSANEQDMEAAKARNTSESLLDRLMLDDSIWPMHLRIWRSCPIR